MNSEQHRYFIELQPEGGPPVSRQRETELRREQAAQFVSSFGEWLRREALEDKVTALAVTALGQVLITCESGIIGKMRHDEMNIASIRNGAMFTGFLGRLPEEIAAHKTAENG